MPTFRGQSGRPSDSNHTKRYNKRIVLALLSVYLIWGSTYLAVRIAVESMPPLLMTSSRLFIAGLLLFIILLIRSHARPSCRQWLGALIVGGVDARRRRRFYSFCRAVGRVRISGRLDCHGPALGDANGWCVGTVA
ncbi:MAG: EamA family transporter [Anaerolineaceae bacterium]|nr:MAG: EamA family transporter [Anaerolineaceae bacterium]